MYTHFFFRIFTALSKNKVIYKSKKIENEKYIVTSCILYNIHKEAIQSMAESLYTVKTTVYIVRV